MPPKSAAAAAAAKGTQCSGRDCGKPIIEKDKAIRYTAVQCERACAEGSNLCTVCTGREYDSMHNKPGGKRWHGRFGAALPPGSHIAGSAWNIATALKEAERAARKATDAAKGAAAPQPVKAAAAAATAASEVAFSAAAAVTAAARNENVALARVASHANADERLQHSLRAVIARTKAEVATAKEKVLNSSEDLRRRIAIAEAAEKKRARATVKAVKIAATGAPASRVKAAVTAASAAAHTEETALDRVEVHVAAGERLKEALRRTIARTAAEVTAAKERVEHGSAAIQGKIAVATSAAAAAEKKRLTATVKVAKASASAVASSAKAVKARRRTQKKASGPKPVRLIYKAASKTKNLTYRNRWAAAAAKNPIPVGYVAPPGSPHFSNSNFNSPGRTNSSGAFSNVSVAAAPGYNVAAAAMAPFNVRRRAAVEAASRPALLPVAAAAAAIGSSSSNTSSSNSSSSNSSSSGSNSSSNTNLSQLPELE